MGAGGIIEQSLTCDCDHQSVLVLRSILSNVSCLSGMFRYVQLLVLLAGRGGKSNVSLFHMFLEQIRFTKSFWVTLAVVGKRRTMNV